MYVNKVLVLNLILGTLFFALDPRWLHEVESLGSEDFGYFFGVAVLLGLFFEFAALHYKSRFIYSRTGARDRKIPLYIALSFFPRFVISGVVIMFAFRSMGLLEGSDFMLLLIALYAAVKEFWVRSRFMKPEDAQGGRDSLAKRRMADLFFLISVLTIYATIWEVYLLPSHHLLLLMLNPPNWIIVGILAYIMVYSLEMPYLLEEQMVGRSRRRRIFSLITVAIPALGVVFQFARMAWERGIFS